MKNNEHLRGWLVQLMLDGITPPTQYTTIKEWNDAEQAKQELEKIPLI